jgi:hypothetical protein
MDDWYYAPWQYELREHLPTGPRPIFRGARSLRVPDPITTTVLAGAYFLAYAPLVQPSPPAKTPDAFPIYNLGGFVV